MADREPALAIVDGKPDSGHDLDRFNRLRLDAERGAGNIAMVTFHQNFAYEDFVEGIRPRLERGGQELRYELHEGLFKRVVNAASEHPDERFVLIIDEINRGNIARIFGELITLIEDSRRTGRDDETWVSLPYSQEQFGVPGNLYVVGTMNTADRSIQLLDTALRRRFSFVEMMPDYRQLTTIEGVDCARMLQTMNERIAVLRDREHQIGHTYLLNLLSLGDLARRFRNQLFPLLQEYFFDDWSRIKVVLGNSPFVVERPGSTVVDNTEFIDEDRKVFERLPDDDPQWTSTNAYRAIYERPSQTGKNADAAGPHGPGARCVQGRANHLGDRNRRARRVRPQSSQTPRWRSGRKQLRGIVTTSRGTVVEILPKIDLNDDPQHERTREVFCRC